MSVELLIALVGILLGLLAALLLMYVFSIRGRRQKDASVLQAQLEVMNRSNENLRKETAQLVQALQKPQTRGHWGEMQLQTVLEHAGMIEHIHFHQQKTFDTAEGQKRPDAVVELPNGNSIVIDAKTPLDAYMSSLSAQSKAEAAELLDAHVTQLKTQIRNLASANYHNLIPDTLEFGVMFIPLESSYSAAVQRAPNLFDFAVQNKVLIATPMSLIGMLNVIALGWRQEMLTENSKEIAGIGRELYERLAQFCRHAQDHGKSLSKTIESYNRAVGSLERRILPSVRKLEKFETASTTKDVEPPEAIDQSVRSCSEQGRDNE